MARTIHQAYAASAAAALIGSVVVTAAIGLFFTWLAVDAINQYGGVLFLLAPVLMGLVASVLFARWHGSITFGQSLGVTCIALLFAVVPLLIFAREGLICLAMVAPLALIGGALGGVIGVRATNGGKRRLPPATGLLLLIFPLAAWGEASLNLAAPSSIVSTSVILPATPAEIWPHLQNFTIEAEPEFIGFRAGIAYPLATRTCGAGVGAPRECILSTGTMVERISVWNPPHQLGFDVLATPPPMSELSPYFRLEPPHLHDTYISRRGEFRLEALPDGTTRLSGTSWYEQRLWPGWYWLKYSDAIIRAIHHRVYAQIAADLAKDRERARLAGR